MQNRIKVLIDNVVAFFFQTEVRGKLIEQLKDLKQLLDEGVLTQNEYEVQKKNILQEMQN